MDLIHQVVEEVPGWTPRSIAGALDFGGDAEDTLVDC